MATVTNTFSQFSPAIKAVHTGLIATGGHLSVAATLSPSGRLKMVELPHHATITGFWLRIQGAADDDQQNFQMGTSATRSGIMAITTLTATYTFSASIALDIVTLDLLPTPKVIRAPGGTRGAAGATTDLMPVRISLSDDVSPKRVWVIGTLGAGVSASAFMTLMMVYTMDGLVGRTTIR